jgi:hypothetical protein
VCGDVQALDLGRHLRRPPGTLVSPGELWVDARAGRSRRGPHWRRIAH